MGTAIPEEKRTLKLENNTYVLNEEIFDNDALILDGTQIEEAWVCHKDGTPYVGMKCEGFPSFGIWSVKDAPFVCLEPWMGRCDDRGFNKEISQKNNINKVELKRIFKGIYNYSCIISKRPLTIQSKVFKSKDFKDNVEVLSV